MAKGDKRSPDQIPDAERDYYLERRYPSFGNLAPRDISSRAAKERCDAGNGVGDSGLAVFLDFRDAIKRDGEDVIRKKYGNLFHMYNKITAEDPYKQPMRIFPAVHYTMGGLWVDYNLMSNVPGLYVLGEANFSDHGANRLGASALMQGLSDGYFVLPYTIGDHLATTKLDKIRDDHPACMQAMQEAQNRINKLIAVQGKRSVDSFHRELGLLMWDQCGMARNRKGLTEAIDRIRGLRDEYWRDVRVLGSGTTLNQSLEKAGRVADFMEFAELLATDALHREESCGGHFREEYQTEEGEAARNDADFSYVGAWEYRGTEQEPILHKEPLVFENVKPSTRSYK
jgi:succinate dehydrogenase / fumarate reductase flavoprotein subunit